MYQMIKEMAIAHPNVLAVYYQQRRMTFKQLLNRIDKTAAYLENKLGVREKDVITLALPNIPNVLILFYACNKLGAICNMVHPLTPYNQLKYIIDQTKSKWAFVFEQRVAKEVEKFKEIRDEIFVCRVEDYLPLFQHFGYHFFMNFRIRRKLGKSWRFAGFKYTKSFKRKGKHSVEKLNNGKDVAVMLHSGSTTGDPKTIVLSNDNFNFIASCASEETCKTPEELIGFGGMLSFLPSFHGFGLGMTMHAPLSNGFASVLLPKFTPKEVVKAMRFTRITCMCGVPTAYEALINDEYFAKCPQLKHLHVAWSGGDSMSVVLQDKWDKIMQEQGSHCKLFEGYGLTESIAAIVVNTYDHNKPNCLGYPLKGVDVEIFSEDGKMLPPNEVGEIAVSAPSNMVSYFKDPNATDAAVKNGFVYTGDLGYKDEDGFIFFSSRKKRVVKVSGVGVFPTEVEHLVETVPGVKLVCAVQIPDARLQAALKLFVVTDYLDKEGLRQDIMHTCRKYLIRWAIPKEIEFRQELPRTQIGKVDFRKLQEEENKSRGIA